MLDLAWATDSILTAGRTHLAVMHLLQIRFRSSSYRIPANRFDGGQRFYRQSVEVFLGPNSRGGQEVPDWDATARAELVPNDRLAIVVDWGEVAPDATGVNVAGVVRFARKGTGGAPWSAVRLELGSSKWASDPTSLRVDILRRRWSARA